MLRQYSSGSEALNTAALKVPTPASSEHASEPGSSDSSNSSSSSASGDEDSTDDDHAEAEAKVCLAESLAPVPQFELLATQNLIQHRRFKTLHRREHISLGKLLCGRVYSSAYTVLTVLPSFAWPRCSQCWP